MKEEQLKELLEGFVKTFNKKSAILYLPKPIMELALLRQYELKGYKDSSENLFDAFCWQDTKEGSSFWSNILHGRYEVFYKKYPEKKYDFVHFVTSSFPFTGAYFKSTDFKNGEKVQVKCREVSDWVEGIFIGMNEDQYVVKVNGSGISSYPVCRKIQPKAEPVVEDKNAFKKEFNQDITTKLAKLSTELFNDYVALQILNGLTPSNRKDLSRRAFYVDSKYVVATGTVKHGGTWISIHKK